MFLETRVETLRCDALLDDVHAPLDPRPQGGLVGVELHNRDALRIDIHVPKQDGQRAPRDGPETDHQNPLSKCQHAAWVPSPFVN